MHRSRRSHAGHPPSGRLWRSDYTGAVRLAPGRETGRNQGAHDESVKAVSAHFLGLCTELAVQPDAINIQMDEIIALGLFNDRGRVPFPGQVFDHDREEFLRSGVVGHHGIGVANGCSPFLAFWS